MYMSRLTLRPERAQPSQLIRISADGGYRLHQLLWELFEGDQPRPFLYRQESRSALPRLLLLSEQEPHDPADLWRIESQLYAPKLLAGERLAFSIRINPIIKKRDDAGRQWRHDLVMEQKQQLKRSGTPHAQWPTQPELAYRAAVQWLTQRAEGGGYALDPNSLLAEEYRQHRMQKRGKAPIRLTTLDCSGLLTVTDPERLLQTLKTGLGPAKGFGCGLLLVRRV